MATYEDIIRGDSFDIDLKFKNRVVQIDKVRLQTVVYERLKSIHKPYIMHLYINLSDYTESVYGLVTFKKRKGVFTFAVKNHFSRVDSVSRAYMYRNYNSIEDLVRALEKDIELAFKKGLHCLNAKLNLVEYEILKGIAHLKDGVELKVRTNGFNKITDFYFERDGEDLGTDLVRGITLSLITELYRRKMLVDKHNSYIVNNIVVSKLGYLSMYRSRSLFDINYKSKGIQDCGEVLAQ